VVVSSGAPTVEMEMMSPGSMRTAAEPNAGAGSETPAGTGGEVTAGPTN